MLKQAVGCDDCDDFITPISQTDLPAHITQSGRYCLTQDATYTPGGPGIQAIQISASDVTLDLNGYTLSNGDTSKTFINVNGITIDANLSNIAIKNGTITGFSQAGIFANGSLLSGGVSKLQLFKIKALNNGLATVVNAGLTGMGGIVMFNPQDVKMYDCDLLGNVLSGLDYNNGTGLDMNNCHCDENITGNFATFGTFAIDIAFGANITTLSDTVNNIPGILDDIVIHNSTFNRNVATSFVGGGLSISENEPGDTIVNVIVENVEANDNQGIFSGPSQTGIAIVEAVVITTSNNVVLHNVQACRNSSIINSTGVFDIEFVGIDISGNTNTEITGCQSTNNTLTIMTPPQSGTFAFNAGIKIGSGTSNFKISDCQVGNLLSDVSVLQASEFPTSLITQSISASQASAGFVSNCQFNNNTVKAASGVFPTTTTFLTEGVDLSGCSDITFEDSSASGNTHAAANPLTQFSLAAGFKSSLSKNIVFRRCFATNNTDTNTGLGFGFSTTEPIAPTTNLNLQYVFDSCIAEGNTASAGLGGGFDIRTCQNSKVINCLADGNTIGIRVSQDTGNPNNCTSNAIANNTLVGNTQAGIFDNISTSAANANAYYSNRAELNGQSPARTNYFGNAFPPAICPKNGKCAKRCNSANKTPIRLWQLPFAPCKVNTNCEKGEILDNISIVS
jgi:hypothetical protein